MIIDIEHENLIEEYYNTKYGNLHLIGSNDPGILNYLVLTDYTKYSKNMHPWLRKWTKDAKVVKVLYFTISKQVFTLCHRH